MIDAIEKFDHLLIQKDNQEALDELVTLGASFQLIYMDPPYNTGRLRGARKNFRDTEGRNWRETILRAPLFIHFLSIF